MSEDHTKQALLEKMAELRFLAAGVRGITAQIDELAAQVAAHDFNSHKALSQEVRSKSLSSDVFPGASEKSIIRVELSPGQFVEGKFQDYRPARVSLWTRDGIIEVPFQILDEDLQRCFPHDPSVQHAQENKLVTDALRSLQEMATASFQEHVAQMKEFQDGVKVMGNIMREMKAENSALKMKNAELEAQVRELE